MPNKFIQIQWTAANLDEAREISQALVAKEYIACASIFPLVESWYVWEDEVECAQEVKVLMKTQEKHYEKIEKYIKKKHSYQICEIVSFVVDQGNDKYLRWISEKLS